MTGNRTRFLVVSVVVCVVLSAATWVAAQGRKEKPEPDSLYKYLSVFTEVLGLVQNAYVNEPDSEQLMAGAYEGTADALGPFAVYVPPSHTADFRKARASHAPDTGLLLVRAGGWVYVAGLTEGSTADKAGFERGDLIAKVDNLPTRALQVWQIEADLAAHKDQPVPVTVVRQGTSKQLTLPVSEGPVVPVVVERVRDIPVLHITRFGEPTEAAVKAELEKLAAMKPTPEKNLVIDLRGTAGGDAELAYRVADLLATGDLGSLKFRDEVKQRFTATGEPVWKGKLVVLVDRGTLGAGELLARVLDEAADATVVGEPTFGHAGHQAQIELASGGILELTDSFYTGPKGAPLSDAVEPDLLVDERSRKLKEKDLTIDELILQRGLGVIEGEAQPAKQMAA